MSLEDDLKTIEERAKIYCWSESSLKEAIDGRIKSENNTSNEDARLRESRTSEIKANSRMGQLKAWKWVSLIVLGTTNSIGFWWWLIGS